MEERDLVRKTLREGGQLLGYLVAGLGTIGISEVGIWESGLPVWAKIPLSLIPVDVDIENARAFLYYLGPNTYKQEFSNSHRRDILSDTFLLSKYINAGLAGIFLANGLHNFMSLPAAIAATAVFSTAPILTAVYQQRNFARNG